MPLSDYQFQVGGLVIGTGTVYRFENVTGFGLGQKRDRRYDIPGAEGAVWGREYRNGPTVSFEGTITCELDPAAAYAALLLLRAAFDGVARTSPRSTQPMGYKMPGAAEQSVLGRPSGLNAPLNQLALGLVPFTATFDCKTQLT